MYNTTDKQILNIKLNDSVRTSWDFTPEVMTKIS